MCLLFAKSGVELLLLTLRGHNQFWRWEAWMLVIGLIAFALLQLWYLHKALIFADPTLVCPSAFCFYNLSSIVNGLVYFDQFSLISPLHLALVGVGIVVLLGGVWVVSIQSGGGGGVDVVAWNDELVEFNDDNSVLCEVPLDSEESGLPTTVPPSGQQPLTTPETQTFTAVPMERGSQSESSLPNTTSGFRQDWRLAKAPQRTESQLYSAPRLPSGRFRRRPTDDARSSSVSTSHNLIHQRTMSHPHPHPQFQPHGPLTPPLGAAAGGFQIGLSPVSPGFTIIPLDRRRRPSTFGAPSFGEMGDETMVADSALRERRRTVSEGEMPRRNRAMAAQQDVAEGSSSTNGGHGSQQAPGARRTPWQWLRALIPGNSKG